MTARDELAAQIAKEITLQVASKLRVDVAANAKAMNQEFTEEVCKFYTTVFKTVKESLSK